MHANLYVYNRGALSEPVMIMYLELGNIINSILYIFGCKKKKKWETAIFSYVWK